MTWEMARASMAGSPGHRVLDRLLVDGWEPFAVVRNAQGEEFVYLKRAR